MSITIISGMNGNAVAAEIANAFDKRTDNTVLGDINITTGKKIITPSIKTDKIIDTSNHDALVIDSNSSTASLYNGRIITTTAPFSNQGIIHITPQYDLPMDSLTINGVIFTIDNYSDINNFYYIGNVGTTYTVSYNYGGTIWDSTVSNLQGGVTDCIVSMIGNRSTQTSGYIQSENMFYMYFKSSTTWTKPTNKTTFDVFLVGGGAPRGSSNGGAGGYTKVYKGSSFSTSNWTDITDINKRDGNAIIVNSPTITVVVGAGGTSLSGGSSSFATVTANGGNVDGTGGNYGGTGSNIDGGTDGINLTGQPAAQGHTTKEFGESGAIPYAGGGGTGGPSSNGSGGYYGGGQGSYSSFYPGLPNSGGGGGGRNGTSNQGGSGIVVVRWTV